MSQSENVVRTIIDLANRYEVDAIQEHLMDDMTFVNPVTGPTGKSGMELFHDYLDAYLWPADPAAVPAYIAALKHKNPYGRRGAALCRGRRRERNVGSHLGKGAGRRENRLRPPKIHFRVSHIRARQCR